MANLSVQDSTTNFVAGIEQFEPVAYWDFKQYSVGYGSGTMPNGKPVKYGDTVTKAQAFVMLRRDCQTAANGVNKYVTASINQNQFDALVSFTYNFGVAKLATSTLLDVVNANPNDFSGVREQLNRWINADGKPKDGLIKRRKKEADLYASGAVSPTNMIWLVLVIALFLFFKK